MIKLLVGLLIAVSMSFAAPAMTATEQEVDDLVSTFHTALLNAMKSEGDFRTRHKNLLPVVLGTFDLPKIARMSVGSATWRKLGKPQQLEFEQLMLDLITSTYADRFQGYNDQTFELLQTSEPRPDKWLVRARLIRVEKAAVSMDYYLSDGRVFNIVADGISDLALRRADYSALMKAQGYDGLTASVRGKIETMHNAQ